ncbi:MAG TPA: cytochrome B5 [Thermoflexia bacterium]|jgi:predicted heme/steroid binding protein|nr:cytochrome B5 [Thermoflexia bacterium]
MRRFTLEDLARYNGKGGMPAYIAYKGQVYDVSSSFLWQNGRHQVLHEAGTDLTAALDQAPHGEDLLKGFPVVGVLIR